MISNVFIQYGSSLVARQCQAHMSSSYIYCTLESSRIKQETIHKESRYGALLWDQETWRGLTNFLFATHASPSALDQMFFWPFFPLGTSTTNVLATVPLIYAWSFQHRGVCSCCTHHWPLQAMVDEI